MCHEGRHHHRRGFGRRGLGRGFYDRDRVRERLEEYRRDLEQELADVSELLKRIGEGEQEAEATTV
jgi:cell division septum initiation protein DivIVA